MTEWLNRTAELVSPDSLVDAASAYCCRYGQAEDEASRRGRLRAIQRSTAALATALEHFRVRGAVHLRGEHPCANMHAEASALYGALSDWSFAVNAAAEVHRRCHCSGNEPD